ncbi:MAG: TIGR00730 family Rossman fold protein [Actinomycetota bacterium]|nr:TIGR00730 family Rossman fold protein [Actinomycetota bacterium]
MATGPVEPRTPDEELIEAESPAVATTQDDAQRIHRVVAELRTGFEALAGLGPAVSVFGSARTPPASPGYELAREVGRQFGRAGFAVITGGGPGAMEAANRGAREVGEGSVGINIELPWEQRLNPYVDVSLRCHYFFTRKVFFVRYASGFVVVPGGFGTMDELFEALTLIQTGKAVNFAVVLLGSDYWGGLLEWMRARMLGEGKIAAADLDLVNVRDRPEDAVAILTAAVAGQELPS